MEWASGLKLDVFFHQWLTRGGFPRIVGGWTYHPTARVVTVTLAMASRGPRRIQGAMMAV
ncbi:hypothetical protein OJF2_66490 [Aquisphaera giovannonii]|uniref:Uncharacterized protein n=1 Tax=Aquisphaera giovannonii TaxID=406548 RepID=A0A5B9WC42_9BACT|nr:hypothetical protein OJF2_66490 [Aquisphaera giovannonii]